VRQALSPALGAFAFTLFFSRQCGYGNRATSRKSNGLWRFAALFPSFPALGTHEAAHRGPPHQKETQMPVGTVKFFNTDKGYGFISPDGGGQDAFVHISAVQAAGLPTLDQDQRLSYELETGRNGRTSAISLQPAD